MGTALLSLGAKVHQDNRAEIINLRSYTHPAFTRIVLDIGKLREYTSGELHQPGQIYVDVLQAKLNPILEGQPRPVKTDYLSQIFIAQKTVSTVRVTVDVNFTKIASYRVYHLFDPFRVVIDIYPAGSAGPDIAKAPASQAPGERPPAKPPDPLPNGYSMARQLGLGV